MKSLILTFHKEKNYGAALQAFALQNFMSKYIETDILDYELQASKITNSKFSVKKILISFLDICKNRNFEKFYKEKFNMTKSVKNIFDIQKVCSNYDAIFCGSDQVWALDIVKDDKDIFFLNFDFNNKIIKNSYAASIGKSNISDDEKATLKRLLKNFDNISVREDTAQKILDELGYTNTQLVVDPTLLLTKEEYISEFKVRKHNEEKYILVYMLEHTPEFIELVNKVQEKLGLKIICFNNRNHFNGKCECRSNSGPAEFVELFANSEIVLTNSFHGTCFSLIFEKTFISFAHATKSTRQISILERVGASDRIYDPNKKLDYYFENRVNYEIVKNNVSKFREEAKKFILESAGVKNE